ncbi:MAG: hypothetical protein QOF01_211 [Thermomicrobiales bacterium]|nr:hypothetical protein [Thermomicrobiales bacterium]
MCRFRPFTPLAASYPLFRRLDRLAVQDRGARRRRPPVGYPHLRPQRVVDRLPRAVPPPGRKVVVDGLPGRVVVGQRPPRDAIAQDVEDGVHQLAHVHGPWATTRLGRRQVRLQARPLAIRQVGGVSCSCHPPILGRPPLFGHPLRRGSVRRALGLNILRGRYREEERCPRDHLPGVGDRVIPGVQKGLTMRAAREGDVPLDQLPQP